jgi:hypothetical protein
MDRTISRALIAVLLWTSPLVAQRNAVVKGRVVDSSHTAIAGASVEAIGVSVTRTDSSGAFQLRSLPEGNVLIRTTRLGFEPTLTIVNTDTTQRAVVDIVLAAAVQTLAPINVPDSLSALSDPGGFEARRRNTTTGGIFILGSEFERRSLRETEQIFHGLPAITVDTGGIVVIKRGELSLRDFCLTGKDVDQFHTCIGAIVFIDGVEMPQPFNVNTVAARSIRGIEIYRGPATTPAVLRSPKTVCGTVAIWTH